MTTPHGDAPVGFVSPFQPPAAFDDLAGDITMADPNAWQVRHVGGLFWRLRPPQTTSLDLLARIAQSKGGAQLVLINEFLLLHLHPDDAASLVTRMVDPDDGFGTAEYQELYRAAVTVGTARPFGPWSRSLRWPPTAGGSSAPSSPSEGYRDRSVSYRACTRYST